MIRSVYMTIWSVYEELDTGNLQEDGDELETLLFFLSLSC